jgi:uncharacterized protein YbbK (DUF523 family)
MKTVLVSSCLLGLPTRYDGSDNLSQPLIDFIDEYKLTPIPVCPEQLAGLPTPRNKCWFKRGDGKSVLIQQGSLCDERDNDVTEQFINGARQTLKIAQMTNCQLAILQQRSPSCGSKSIYLNQELTPGMGITAALLEEHGIQVFSDDSLPIEKM